MFEYFPGNYVWNLGVVATLNAGGTIDEVDRACRPLKDLAVPGLRRRDRRLHDRLAERRRPARGAGRRGSEGGSPAHRRTEVLPGVRLRLAGGADAERQGPRPQR